VEENWQRAGARARKNKKIELDWTCAEKWWPHHQPGAHCKDAEDKSNPGTARVWVAGETVWSPCYTRTISEHFRDVHYKVLL